MSLLERIASAFAEDQFQELGRARAKHPRSFNSLHEGFAIILEEVDEVWDEIKKRSPNRAHVRAELVQIAAMAQRMAEDLKLAE